MRFAPAPTSAAEPRPHAVAPEVVRGGRWAVLVLGGLLALVFAPPFLPDGLRLPLEHAFSLVCHRMPDRSFHLHDVALGVCQRDTGIFVGMFAGALLYPLVRPLDLRIAHRAPWVLAAAAVPMAVDWSLTVFGLWANTPLSRSLTGLLFGLVAGVFLTRGFVELAAPSALSSP